MRCWPSSAQSCGCRTSSQRACNRSSRSTRARSKQRGRTSTRVSSMRSREQRPRWKRCLTPPRSSGCTAGSRSATASPPATRRVTGTEGRADVPSNQPLGTSGDLRRRLLLHHVPLALASAVVFVVFMSVPLFDASVYPHPDLMSGPFPKLGAGSGTGPTDHGTMDTRPMGHTGHHTGSMAGHSDHTGSRSHIRGGATSADHDRDLLLSRRIQQSTVATGYLALGLLAVTLLLGPANLLLRRRNPVSSYLRRDVGMWTAIFSVVHVSQAVLTHVSHGGELVSSFGHFFVAEDGNPLTNSFGLGNWTGLAALVIVVGLLAFSTDFALGKLK